MLEKKINTIKEEIINIDNEPEMENEENKEEDISFEIKTKRRTKIKIKDDKTIIFIRPLLEVNFFDLSLMAFWFYTEYSPEMYLNKRRVLDAIKKEFKKYGESWVKQKTSLVKLAEKETVIFKRAKRWVKDNFKQEILEPKNDKKS